MGPDRPKTRDPAAGIGAHPALSSAVERVFIDDCCQPVFDATELILGRPRNVDKVLEARRTVERNPNRELTRAMANARTAPPDNVT